MSIPTLLFASSGDASAAAVRHLSPAMACWPSGKAPPVEASSIRQLLVRLDGLQGHHEERSLDAPIPECVLLSVSRTDDPGDTDRCIMDLHANGIPVLVLAEDAARWQILTGRGISVLGWNAAPAIVAAMLAALWQRQVYVQSLTRELALAVRCQTGIRAEIERMHEELQLAANVQQEFTATPMPKLAGLEFAALFRPVSAVSGDIYCVRSVEPDTAGFFIADAVGHGVPAALLTMVLTNSLIAADEAARDVCGRCASSRPGDVLARLNRRLVEGSVSSGRFATAVYGTINARTREVTVAGAGHPAPVVLSPTGARSLATEGPLLGVFPDAEFTQVSTVLEPGETLVLYSDGFECAFNGDSPRKNAKAWLTELRNAFAHQEVPSRDALSELEILIDEQYGSLHQQDDVTIVAIRALAAVMSQAA